MQTLVDIAPWIMPLVILALGYAIARDDGL